MPQRAISFFSLPLHCNLSGPGHAVGKMAEITAILDRTKKLCLEEALQSQEPFMFNKVTRVSWVACTWPMRGRREHALRRRDCILRLDFERTRVCATLWRSLAAISMHSFTHASQATAKSRSCYHQNWQLCINLWTLRMLKICILKKLTEPIGRYNLFYFHTLKIELF